MNLRGFTIFASSSDFFLCLSPRPLSIVLSLSLPTLSCPPHRRSFAHTCNHWFRGFHKLQGWETRFFNDFQWLRNFARLWRINTEDEVEEFAFSKGVDGRHAPQSNPHHRFDVSRAKKKIYLIFPRTSFFSLLLSSVFKYLKSRWKIWNSSSPFDVGVGVETDERITTRNSRKYLIRNNTSHHIDVKHHRSLPNDLIVDIVMWHTST